MRLTITLERGDAALGTLDMELLKDLVAHAVEEAQIETILRQMPPAYARNSAPEYGWEEGHHPGDFEESARGTLRWLIRRFRVSARVPTLPSPADALCEVAEVRWPREEAQP